MVVEVVVVVCHCPPAPKDNHWEFLVEWITSIALSPTPPPTLITSPVINFWVDPVVSNPAPVSKGNATERWSIVPELPKFSSNHPVFSLSLFPVANISGYSYLYKILKMFWLIGVYEEEYILI